MKIAIDISQIPYGTGVSFYTRNLLRAIAEVDRENQYLLFGFSWSLTKNLHHFADSLIAQNRNFSKKIYRFPLGWVEFWVNNFGFCLEKLIGPTDVYHSSDWVQFDSHAKKITTLHDFGFYRYPQTAHPKILEVHLRRLKRVRQKIDLAIAISQSTASDAQNYLGLPEEKIVVIHEACGDEFKKLPAKEVSLVCQKYQIKPPYFLAVATIEPRKNLSNIFAAFTSFSKVKPRFQLVIVGKTGWDYQVRKNRRQWQKVVFTGYLPTNELVALYSGASGLVFPSLHEGFGLPILEAFACGCPVLTSDRSSMPEVAGKSAILVNPENPEEIKLGLLELLNKRHYLIKDGLARLKKFSWEKTARETIAQYEKINQSR